MKKTDFLSSCVHKNRTNAHFVLLHLLAEIKSVISKSSTNQRTRPTASGYQALFDGKAVAGR